MKYAYVSYCRGTAALWGLPEEGRAKELDRIGKEGERYGLRVVLRGEPYGVSEDVLFVFESDEGLDTFNKFQNEVSQPFDSSRTISVVLK